MKHTAPLLVGALQGRRTAGSVTSFPFVPVDSGREGVVAGPVGDGTLSPLSVAGL